MAMAPQVGLERKVLFVKSMIDLAFTFPKTQATWIVVRVCSPHTHGVTYDSLPKDCHFLFRNQRLACEIDVGCKIIRVCEVRAAV